VQFQADAGAAYNWNIVLLMNVGKYSIELSILRGSIPY